VLYIHISVTFSILSVYILTSQTRAGIGFHPAVGGGGDNNTDADYSNECKRKRTELKILTCF
jgi:hypothetical protein